jgi:hypothetical protein
MTLSLTGKVSDSITSTGVSGATITIIDGANAGKSTITDAAGAFSFIALQPSSFTVNVSANNYASQSRGVTLTSSQTLSLRLAHSISLTGQVTDGSTSAPISGATVSINGRYRAITDSLGNYTVSGCLDAGGDSNITSVSANNYASDFRYIRGMSLNVRLYRIKRIMAGASTSVTVAPDDTLCVNNIQDTPGVGQDYVCRSVLVTAPTDGIMTLEALSTQGAARPPLEVEAVAVPPCCSERIGNPTSIQVTAGTQVVVNVEVVLGSGAQSFTLSTSMARQQPSGPLHRSTPWSPYK